MNECGFWFWFVRPMAEVLGGLAMFSVFAILAGGIWLLAKVLQK